MRDTTVSLSHVHTAGGTSVTTSVRFSLPSPALKEVSQCIRDRVPHPRFRATTTHIQRLLTHIEGVRALGQAGGAATVDHIEVVVEDSEGHRQHSYRVRPADTPGRLAAAIAAWVLPTGQENTPTSLQSSAKRQTVPTVPAQAG